MPEAPLRTAAKHVPCKLKANYNCVLCNHAEQKGAQIVNVQPFMRRLVLDNAATPTYHMGTCLVSVVDVDCITPHECSHRTHTLRQ